MPNRREASDSTLIGLPRIARILHVTHPTATLYAARRYFPTQEIDGRLYAKLGDVMRYKTERERQRSSDKIPAA